MTTATPERVLRPRKLTTLRDLKDDYLDCRDLRHAWAKSNDWNRLKNTRGQDIEFTRVVICRRCSTERHETYALPTMEVVRRRYRYPDHFLLHRSDKGRTPVQDVRREMYQRLTGELLG